jgi:hypothetical protein
LGENLDKNAAGIFTAEKLRNVALAIRWKAMCRMRVGEVRKMLLVAAEICYIKS